MTNANLRMKPENIVARYSMLEQLMDRLRPMTPRGQSLAPVMLPALR